MTCPCIRSAPIAPYIGAVARADIPVTRAPTVNYNVGLQPFATNNGFDFRDNALLLGVRYAFGAR